MTNYSGIPLINQPATEILDNKFHELLESGDMFSMLMKARNMDMHVSDGERTAPDPYGCEKFFVDFFETDEMKNDFPLIARDFLAHEFANISNYENVSYFDMDSGEDWPEALFNRFMLNLIVNAANGGSEYAKALILQLYKTYYKKEYKVLKKFSTISADEILAITKPEGSKRIFFANLSRVLYIAKLSGIRIKPDSDFLFVFLNDISDKFNERAHYPIVDEVMEIYEDVTKEIEEKYDIDKLYRLDDKICRFMGNVLEWLGYNPCYIDWCDIDDNGIIDRLACTLALLRKTYTKKNKEYSAEELIIYSHILKCANAATANQDWMTDALRTIAFGTDGNLFYDDFPPQFHPEDVQYKDQKDPKTVNTITQKTVMEPIRKEEPLYNESKLREELDALHRKVRMLESDNSILRQELSDKRKVDEENRAIKIQMEELTRELAALRSYAYNLTESDEPVEEESLEKMKNELKDRRIIIIGGHPKWVSKLKKEFPAWEFVNPDASGTTPVSIVDKADRVYFFTDTISHSKYNQFISVIRERKVAFSYIHGVNVSNNIRDIYLDMREE